MPKIPYSSHCLASDWYLIGSVRSAGTSSHYKPSAGKRTLRKTCKESKGRGEERRKRREEEIGEREWRLQSAVLILILLV